MAADTGENPIVIEYKEFLSARETGLTQGSAAWGNPIVVQLAAQK